MDNIDLLLEEIKEMLPNVKVDYLKIRSYLLRDDIPYDEEPLPVIDHLAGRSIICECENSEHSLLFDIDKAKDIKLKEKKYEIKIQKNKLSVFNTYRCRSCEKYPKLQQRLSDLKTNINSHNDKLSYTISFLD